MKKSFKSQASSGRATFGAPSFGGFGSSAFDSGSSPLSHVYEPPNLTTISDANVVVQLKNLMKKDGKTKSKALEDLIAYTTTNKADIEEGVFTAYIKLYPRLSIDAERRVRQLSHTLVGHIVVKCGKRVAPYLPQIAGPWLCGQHDPDRAVSRSANEAFQAAFNTSEKAQNFRRLFQRQIVEYCRDAVLNETPQTLTDTRNVSKETADTIYYRVVATSLTLIATFIMNLPNEELDKVSDAYTAILTHKVFLELLSSYDPPTRNAVMRILRGCIQTSKFTSDLDYTLTSTVIFGKVLPSDQTSTAGDVLALLVLLTEQQPSIWKTESGSKKSPDRRLRSFTKRGAQSSASEYWDSLTSLFDRMPPEILPADSATAKEWMMALLEGVTQRQEPRHTTSAWSNYTDISMRLYQRLPSSEQDAFVNDWLLPILDQYVNSSEATSKWIIPVSKPEPLVAKLVLQNAISEFIPARWPRYTDQLTDLMKLSQPEQSNEFDKSQAAVVAAVRRWLALQLAILSGQHGISDEVEPVILKETARLQQAAMDLLVFRRGKPYSAAFTITELAKHHEKLNSGEARDLLQTFMQTEAAELLSSPSRDYLLDSLHSISDPELFDRVWNSWATRLTRQDGVPEESDTALRFLLNTRTQATKDLARKHGGVQSFLKRLLDPSRLSTIASTELTPLLTLASNSTTEHILAASMAALETSDDPGMAIDGLEVLDQAKPGLLREFATNSSGSELLPRIINIRQSASEDLEEKARQLHERLIGVDGRPLSPKSATGMIRRELENTSQASLPISVISEIAESQLQDYEGEMIDLLASLADSWDTSLRPFSERKPASSLAMMNPLAGAIHLLDGKAQSIKSMTDNEGLTQPIRIGTFARFILAKLSPAKLEARQEAHLLSLLSWTALLVDDNTNVFNSNEIWVRSPFSSTENVVTDFVARAKKLVNQRLSNAGTDSELFAEFTDINLESILSVSPFDFCKARSYLTATTELYEGRGFSKQKISELEEDVKEYRKDGRSLPLCASVSVLSSQFSQSAFLQRYLNELVADLSTTGESLEKTMQNLVILNLMLQTQPKLDGTVQKHRLVLLVKHLTTQLGDAEKVPVELRAEAATALRYLVPHISNIYGEQWSQILSAMSSMLRDGFSTPRLDEKQLVLVHSALRLHTALQLITYESEPNEDLVDAFKECKDDVDGGILALLSNASTSTEFRHLPLRITEDLVARKARKLDKISDVDAENLWPQLDSKSPALQSSAFELLGRYTDERQEAISFDAALEKKIAHLPEQLLSLILDAPDIDTVISASFEDEIPHDLKAYILSWQLVFRHFDKASANVRDHYVEDIRSSDYLPPLLDLIYDFLGFTTSKPIEATKFPITSHDWSGHDDPEVETQSALIHLFYLTLTHLPSLAKQHYLSQSNRTLSNNISTWTAKHISPHVITSLFSRVTTWSTTFASDPEYENFSLKISPKSREVTASYLIDEQPMSILIALPETYPLTGATVTGLSRAALDPKKWQSWIRGCQGVIQFSNGDLVDGLRSWRTNVKGALAGQSECAICYSIISGDKQLPTKRCSTCRNMFHNGCLFKWFRTSNSSSCPLCRQAWSYSG
ncbi:hypothetical protein KVT40_002861 [Elsinoe batatas]|uniref:E3 ubiquitin-protein ligase listerin n=1 Tax=Elsinoe batatas TaxID=2601811 RepID=A0A8K0PGI1_9PEZI|nr:hypothetical protein KVT40_002861 [Elsinoe batatas]